MPAADPVEAADKDSEVTEPYQKPHLLVFGQLGHPVRRGTDNLAKLSIAVFALFPEGTDHNPQAPDITRAAPRVSEEPHRCLMSAKSPAYTVVT